METLESSAFSYCNKLVNITIPDGVTSIGRMAFDYCWNLKEINIPAGVKSLESETFNDCRSLETITLHEGLKSIDGYPSNGVFTGCKALKEISIPSTVTTFSEVFFDCISLMNIHVAAGNILFKEVDGVVYSNDLKTMLYYPRGRETFSMIAGIETIAESAMMTCKNLKSVFLPEGITVIEKFGISHCEAMTELHLPNSLTKIGANAFYNCSALQDVEIPSGITEFGDGAFSWCKALTSIVIPENMEKIPSSMFYNCTNLTTVTIQKGVTGIGSYAFSGCDSLTTIFIPATVIEIGGNAFGSLGSDLNICGYDDTYAETYAHDNEYSWNSRGSVPMDTLELPKNLKSIEANAFESMKAEKIVIPAGCAFIAEGAFAQCSNLMLVEIHQPQGSFDGYDFGEDVTVTYISP